MSWTCSLARSAAKRLRALPTDRQAKIARAIEEMEEDPTLGDVRPIKSGKLKGALRKRIGPYRIIYSVDSATRQVDIAATLVRGDLSIAKLGTQPPIPGSRAARDRACAPPQDALR